MNIQDWFPLGLSGWISLQSKGLSSIFSNTTVLNHQFLGAQPSLWSNSHIHTWLLTSIPEYWKNHKFGSMDLVSKVTSLLFKMLYRLVIAFLPKSKLFCLFVCLFVLFFNFMAAVTICSDIGDQQDKVCHCFCCFPIYLPLTVGTRYHDLFMNSEF